MGQRNGLDWAGWELGGGLRGSPTPYFTVFNGTHSKTDKENFISTSCVKPGFKDYMYFRAVQCICDSQYNFQNSTSLTNHCDSPLER
ncbi:hypothetical protein CDAR_163741 [Caerostris darwini]|uniref:Uncharacterized protein n=1 Tax=Caerostris darwini TaxID=1538125 RepID=A0AAV4RPW5_9ARAC|nr:hypothetical protein CDAR_163741 [Caerostris darwini]